MSDTTTENTEEVAAESVAYSPETDATEIAIPSNIATLSYGGREYEIKPMGMDQIIEVGRFVGNTFAKMNSGIQKELLKSGAAETSVLTYFNYLDAKDIPIFISMITGEKDLEFIAQNFVFADALGVIVKWGKIEKIADVFTQLGDLGEMFGAFIPQAK